jgi:orotate phosphoribosyltransferase
VLTNSFSCFIEDTNCFQEESFNLLSTGTISPYSFSTPRPLTGRQLDIIGMNGLQIISKYTNINNIHIIAIATYGIPIAATILQYLYRENKQVRLSIIKPDENKDNEEFYMNKNEYTILVDNSIKTTYTSTKAIEILNKYKVKVNLIIYLYDYGLKTIEHKDYIKDLEKKLNLKIISIFSILDLLEYYFNTDRDKYKYLLNHTVNNGTERIKKLLKPLK